MSGGDDRDSFAKAMERLGDVEGVSEPAPRGRPGAASPGRPPTPAAAPEAEAHGFRFPVAGERLLAHRSGLRRRELRQLRGGKLQPERSIDLHGYDRRAARAFLVAEITAAQAAAEYCVRVIHGRGLRSEEGEAVLKLVLPDWLTSPPLASMVLAFAPAQPRDGGPGACYVLLG